MDIKYDFEGTLDQRIAYVRSVNVAELPEDLQQQAFGLERLYAVHSAAGERLALVRDRDLAFVLARQNDLQPVAVH